MILYDHGRVSAEKMYTFRHYIHTIIKLIPYIMLIADTARILLTSIIQNMQKIQVKHYKYRNTSTTFDKLQL